MSDGSTALVPIDKAILWEDYYANLHGAYNSMQDAFAASGLTQDEIAALLDVDKSLISKRFNGTENLTLKTMSHMGTAMKCRLHVAYVPYDQVGLSNYHVPTASYPANTAISGLVGASSSVPANKAKVLEAG